MSDKPESIASDSQPSLPLYDDQRQKKLIDRLNRIEGQVRGVKAMVEQQRRCPDVLQQMASVQAALRGVTAELMRNYLERCVTEGIRKGDEKIYDELMHTIRRFTQ